MPGDFVDLIAWQQGVILVKDVFQAAHVMRGPGSIAAADQLRRAVESIPANVAEGYGRATARDFCRFLTIAAASAAEVESHLLVSVAVGRLPESRAEPIVARCRRVRALIRGLARQVAKRSGSQGAAPSPSPITQPPSPITHHR
jgi:four helix bundle protein